MFVKVKECFGWSYFQARFHAYVEMSWYFGMFAVISLVCALWAGGIVDASVVERLKNPDAVEACGKINTALRLFALASLAEAGICLMLVVSVPSIMRSANWALFGLIALALLLIQYIGKFAVLTFDVVWIWSFSPISCSVETPSLYTGASQFLIIMLSLYCFQLLFGTTYLLACGLEDAVGEGVHWVNSKYGSKTEEEENLLPSDDDDEPED